MLTHPICKGRTAAAGILPAACLSLLTLGTVSFYGRPGDFTVPFIILMTSSFLVSAIVLLSIGTAGTSHHID